VARRQDLASADTSSDPGHLLLAIPEPWISSRQDVASSRGVEVWLRTKNFGTGVSEPVPRWCRAR
jgi:hypothetical protein